MGQAKLRGTREERVLKAKNNRIYLGGMCPEHYRKQNDKNIIEILSLGSDNEILANILRLKKSITPISRTSCVEINVRLAMEVGVEIAKLGGRQALLKTLDFFNADESKVLINLWQDLL